MYALSARHAGLTHPLQNNRSSIGMIDCLYNNYYEAVQSKIRATDRTLNDVR